MSVAFSVGLAILIGVMRIIRGWPIQYLIIGGYIVVMLMTTISPKEIIGVAFAGQFHLPGTGIAFVVPVEQVIGLESQMEKFKEEVRESYF